MNKRTIGLYVTFAILLIGGGFAYLNKQYIKDLYIVNTTDISAESSILESKIDLTPKAEFLYQASETELQKSSDFSKSCSGIEKQAIVLGCYTNQRIFVYDVTDSRLSGVREVTAAHELLHAAYERLSGNKKQEVDLLLQQQAKKTTDKTVLDTLDLYKDLSQEDLLNEMHSIFGTELGTLSPQLENYYKLYFKKRSRIVNFSDQYQKVFKELQSQNDSLKAQLENLKRVKSRDESQLANLKAQIDAKQNQLEALKRSDPAEYNQQIPAYNQLADSYNSLVASYKLLINEMNDIITKINANVTEQNNLTKKLNSNFNSI